jgi:hypothetical protein
MIHVGPRKIAILAILMVPSFAGFIVGSTITSAYETWKSPRPSMHRVQPKTDPGLTIYIILIFVGIAVALHVATWAIRRSLRKREKFLELSGSVWNMLIFQSYSVGVALGLAMLFMK